MKVTAALISNASDVVDVDAVVAAFTAAKNGLFEVFAAAAAAASVANAVAAAAEGRKRLRVPPPTIRRPRNICFIAFFERVASEKWKIAIYWGRGRLFF